MSKHSGIDKQKYKYFVIRNTFYLKKREANCTIKYKSWLMTTLLPVSPGPFKIFLKSTFKAKDLRWESLLWRKISHNREICINSVMKYHTKVYEVNSELKKMGVNPLLIHLSGWSMCYTLFSSRNKLLAKIQGTVEISSTYTCQKNRQHNGKTIAKWRHQRC